MSDNSHGDARRDRQVVPVHQREEDGDPPGPAWCPAGQGGDAVRWLGAELRRLRLELGISQRELTRLLGLSAHSNLGEYERGSRIPPRDIVLACERLFTVQPGYLQDLRSQALRERARALSWPGFGCPGGG